ncbi:MAG TPA: TlpA disulfide reductase family protein [Dehalococcoidia bacterium]|nr:TlpA disulfide reductase family protein [Dehalococcoidia bacterium]
MTLDHGILAPHFTLLGLDGREYAIPRDQRSQPLLIAFFRVKCATCDVAYPYLNKLRETYPEGWQLWSVCQDEPARAAEYAERFAISHPVLLDATGLAVSKLYDPASTPTLYLVAPNGRLDMSSEGFAKEDLNAIARRIAEYVGSVPVEIASEVDGNPAMKPGCMARQRFPQRPAR